MKTKIVYTIVSGIEDTYLEQLLVSVYSVRLYHPNDIIEVVTDECTYKTLSGARALILQYANKVVPIPCSSEYNKMQRSRYLKTNLRKFVTGDYLFIDCDTVISGSLSDIDNFKFDLGLVADLNGELSLRDGNTIEKCKKAGFANVDGTPYFNSGVIYAKDTPVAHCLYEEWYRLWKESDTKGVTYDQPALCQANINLGLPIKELSGIWNCQFKFSSGYKYLKKALILHYYSNNGNGCNSTQERIFDYVKEKGCIDAVVDKMIRNPRTIFSTALAINGDKAFEFFNSEMLHYFFNVPLAYRFALQLARVMEKPFLILSKLKRRWN